MINLRHAIIKSQMKSLIVFSDFFGRYIFKVSGQEIEIFLKSSDASAECKVFEMRLLRTVNSMVERNDLSSATPFPVCFHRNLCRQGFRYVDKTAFQKILH